MANVLKITEQKPTGNSIFCTVIIHLEGAENCTLTYGGNMYFVCDLKRQVTQYFSWLEDYKEQLTKLDYKL
jgi:hypothetical protein